MVARISSVLADLAEHDIPADLASHGDTGHRHGLYTGPVSVHVHRLTGAWIGVEDESWGYHGRHGYRWGGLPPEVTGFVAAFDAGEHPHLTAEEEAAA